jgi:hypothetical protein
MKVRLLHSIVLFIFLSNILCAQNENKKWYFGKYGGLDFTVNPPVTFTGSPMHALEGCTSIADGAGNILFFSDGSQVFNKQHQVMANGTFLAGDGSTTQAALGVKKPGSSNIYYLFTCDNIGGPYGISYSVIDMSLAAGNGSVITKNVLLYAPSTEKMTSALHCNGTDIWVVTHDYISNLFRSFLVTASGVNTVAVTSSVGPQILSSNRTLGQMKISPNGKKLGLAVWDSGTPGSVELYDFNNSTGIVSNPIILGTPMAPYGCEFSPDCTKFYVSRWNAQHVYQWDLCAGSDSAIIASTYSIIVTSSVITWNGSLQLAPDGKIYLTKYPKTSLAVINNPDIAGAGCNYVDNGLPVQANCELGLPNFINTIGMPPPQPFNYTVSCATVFFSVPPSTIGIGCIPNSYTPTSVSWNFGDIGSGTQNVSALNNPSHVYPAAGIYLVKLIRNYTCYSDTVKIPVNLNTLPSLTVTGGFTMCAGEKKTLVASGATSYSWSVPSNTANTSATITLSPANTSTYLLTGTTGTCSAGKIITINVSKCLNTDQDPGTTRVKIFPNPVNEKLFVENEIKITMRIIDATGRIIIEKKLDAGNNVIETDTLANGYYTVLCTDESGMKIHYSLIKSNHE